MRISLTVALAVVSLSVTQLHAAGFDCAKASTPTEKAICADPTLSELDSKLTTLYSSLRKSLPPDQVTTLKSAQVAWLRESRTGTDKAALADAYRERIARLDAIQKAAGSFSPYGEFSVDHPIEMYNQETQEFESMTATDSYVLTRVNDKAIAFSINITGHNAHQCECIDTARVRSPGVYVWSGRASETDDSGEPPCTITFTVLKDRVHVVPEGEGCRGFCGMRAWLSDVDLRAVERAK